MFYHFETTAGGTPDFDVLDHLHEAMAEETLNLDVLDGLNETKAKRMPELDVLDYFEETIQELGDLNLNTSGLDIDVSRPDAENEIQFQPNSLSPFPNNSETLQSNLSRSRSNMTPFFRGDAQVVAAKRKWHLYSAFLPRATLQNSFFFTLPGSASTDEPKYA